MQTNLKKKCDFERRALHEQPLSARIKLLTQIMRTFIENRNSHFKPSIYYLFFFFAFASARVLFDAAD